MSHSEPQPGGEPAKIIDRLEITFTDLTFDGKRLTGKRKRADGETLPGNVELKLMEENVAEMRQTGDDLPEMERRLVLKFRRQ